MSEKSAEKGTPMTVEDRVAVALGRIDEQAQQAGTAPAALAFELAARIIREELER